jgi:trk system potassium uptake protein TrkA
MKHQVLVIGLGRFGGAAARELAALGHEVLAIDSVEERVNDIAPEVTHALQLDASDESALRAAGAGEFEHAIVAITGHIEASIFATMALRNLGVSNVISKAATGLHGSILERVGASRVVYPEREVGIRLAHTFAIPNVLDYIDAGPDFAIAKIAPPPAFEGKSLSELNLPNRLSLTPIALRRGQKVTVNPHRDERLREGDELVLIGRDEGLEKLAD